MITVGMLLFMIDSSELQSRLALSEGVVSSCGPSGCGCSGLRAVAECVEHANHEASGSPHSPFQTCRQKRSLLVLKKYERYWTVFFYMVGIRWVHLGKGNFAEMVIRTAAYQALNIVRSCSKEYDPAMWGDILTKMHSLVCCWLYDRNQ